FALDGREYYLTQFVEYAQNGIYAKYRLVVVDGEIFLRHVMFSRMWMVHNKTQDKENTLRQKISKSFIREIKPFIQPIISQIYERLGLDYFGIDCNIDKDMNLLVFEINPNMNIFIETKGVFESHIEKARQKLIHMLASSKDK
ncbi:MAG: hypothetical protein IE909_13840, partial [Campylobacterales bacterium]|nr:hypothetical protein [Campylobacterales bacterium]